MHVDLSSYKDADIAITAVPYNEASTITVESINEFAHESISSSMVQMLDTGYRLTFNSNSYEYNIPCQIDPGEYTLYASFIFSDTFVKDEFSLKLTYTDGTSTTLAY